MSKQKTLLLVGGGTGGHAGPILAVYKKMAQDKNCKIVVVGVGTPEEKEFFNSIPNYTKICAGKFHRQFTIRNIGEIVKFVIGYFQSLFLLLKFKPQVIFSKGGFVSLPLTLAARTLKISYFLHESDIEMGKVNRIMAKSAEKVFVTYPAKYYRGIDSKKIVWSGLLLREGYAEKPEKNVKTFGFSNGDPVIFLTGGSQGALNLSKVFLQIASGLLDGFNIIHQAGKHSIEIADKFAKDLPEEKSKKYYFTDLLGDKMMLSAIGSADLIISRAGSTIVELAIASKLMILVPWRYSAQDHQLKNAEFFKANNAADVITEDQLTPEVLRNHINDLFQDREKREKIAQSSGKLFPKDGVSIVCDALKERLDK